MGFDDAQIALRGGRAGIGRDDAAFGQERQDQIAPLAGALGKTPRVVIGGTAKCRDQQRYFMQLEIREALAEVEAAAEAEAMHGARAVLAEVNLVDVGRHELGLVVGQVEDHGHDRFARLARERLLVSQEIALHELLRERAAALLYLARAQIDEQRACNAARIDTEVLVETLVLDRLERLDQQRRNVVRLDDEPVLAVRRKDAADRCGIQTQDRNRIAVCRAHIGDATGIKAHGHGVRGLQPVEETERARDDREVLTEHTIRTGCAQGFHAPKPGALKLLDDIGARQGLAGIDLQRRGVDRGREIPMTRLELAQHDPREVSRVAHAADGQQREPDEHGSPAASGRLFLAHRLGHRRPGS